MAQFDVLKFESGYALDCQADILSHLHTRFIVPLRARNDGSPIKSRLNPVFELDGEQWVMMTEFASTIFVKNLGPRVTSLASQRDDIIAALDVLITGI
jgi:toxin CcdB